MRVRKPFASGEKEEKKKNGRRKTKQRGDDVTLFASTYFLMRSKCILTELIPGPMSASNHL